MDGRTIGFIIWSIIGIMFICLSIYAYFSKKPMRFWANMNVFEVSDTNAYNHAVSKLFCIFGIVFVLLGIPLLAEKHSALILLSVVGIMVESIIAMIVYSIIIEKKYKKEN